MKVVLRSLMVVLLMVVSAHAQSEIIDFDSDRWNMINAEIVDHLGRKSLSGYAVLNDVEFENGVIEVDIAADGSRSYPGILFRIQSPGNNERFYTRPHRTTGLYEDALQYTPTINGIAGWQLYSGEGFTAAATIPYNQWVHVKMEISGTQARVFIDNADEPALVINDLKHGISNGAIGLLGPKDATARFSNFQYRIDDNLRFEPPPEIQPTFGILTDWEISPSFKGSVIDPERTPEEQGLTDLTWEQVTCEPTGLVDIARYRNSGGGESDWVWARTNIAAEETEVRKIWFGYSDYVFVFLNGKLLFTGNSAYHARDPAFQGIIGLNDCVYLPLKKGQNELLMLVGETFGGWGFMAQDGDALFEHEGMTKAWDLQQTFKYPESALYDPARDILYVSNYFNGGREFISKVKPTGEVETLEWVTGLMRPTGLAIHGGKLYAVERRSLAKIDLESGEILARYPIPGSIFPNDVAFDASGNAYISDNERQVLYKFDGDTIDVWLENEQIFRPNGLLVDGDALLVGNTGDGCLKSVGLADKMINTIACFGRGSNVDGLCPDGRGNYIVSDFNGRVFVVSPTGEITNLLNTSAQKIYCADLTYIPKHKLMVIPTLYDCRLMAYKCALPE